MNSPKYERLFLQTIFDYFHEKAEWPTYRHVDLILLSIDPTIDIKEISQNLPNGFANRFPFNDILDDPAILSIEAIRRCDNSEGDLADFINAVRLFVDKYIELREDNPRVTGADLKSQLNMSDDSIKRVGKLIYGEHMLYQTHGVDRVDGYGSTWLYTLKREIRRFYGITSIEDYLERRDKEIITARQQATGQLTLLLGQMYCKPGSNNVDKGIILWKKNLTEPNEKGVKLEVALLNALTRLGVPTLFGGDVERILPDTGETIHSGPSTPIFDLVALHIESPMRGPTAVLISCKSNNDQPRLKDMENLSDVSHKVSKLLPAWLVFGALVNLGEPSSDDFNYRDDVRIWKQSHLQALFHAKEHRYVAQFLTLLAKFVRTTA